MIKRFFKLVIAIVFFYSGGFFIFRFVNNLLGKRLTIVAYHRVTNEPVEKIDSSLPYLFITQTNFIAQLKFYKKFYHIIKLSDLKKHKNSRSLPFNSLIITFDDGYEDNYKLAYPVMKKNKIPATIYLTTNYIGTNNITWWDEIYYKLSILRKEKAYYRTKLMGCDLRDIFDKFVNNPALLFSDLSRLDKLELSHIIESLNKLVPNSHSLISANKFMKWEQVIDMSNYIEFGSHTCSHSSLDSINNETIMAELRQSKSVVKQNIDVEVRSFAFPSGHYSKKTAMMVKKAGFDNAVTLDRGINSLKNMYTLKRINIWDGTAKSLFFNFSKSLLALALARI